MAFLNNEALFFTNDGSTNKSRSHHTLLVLQRTINSIAIRAQGIRIVLTLYNTPNNSTTNRGNISRTNHTVEEEPVDTNQACYRH